MGRLKVEIRTNEAGLIPTLLVLTTTTTTATAVAMSLNVRGRPNALPFIRRRDGTLVYSSGTFVRPLPIPVPGSSFNSSGFHGAATKEMDMRDLDKEEDLLDYADGGEWVLWVGVPSWR